MTTGTPRPKSNASGGAAASGASGEPKTPPIPGSATVAGRVSDSVGSGEKPGQPRRHAGDKQHQAGGATGNSARQRPGSISGATPAKGGDKKMGAHRQSTQHRKSASYQPQLHIVADNLAEQHERRFRQLVLLFFIFTIMVGALVPLIHVPEPPRDEVKKLPPHLAKVIVKKKKKPTPPEKPLAKVIEPEKPKPPEKKTPPKDEAKPEPKPKAQPRPKPAEKKPEPPPKEKSEADVAKARERAASSGVFAAQDVLADMRKTLSSSKSGAKKRRLSTEGQRAAKEADSALQAKAGRTSGGAGKPVMMRMSEPRAALAKSDIVVESETPTEAPPAVAAATSSAKQAKTRNEAAIRRVFDQHKGAIDSLYRRALRRDPSLQGRVLVEVVIEPSGAISSSRIVESELNNKSLEARLLARIGLINFGAKAVEQQKVQYAFEFVPS